MADLEANRTLVKSPPELWAELSDPESLARHLSAFGEIRITRLQPEEHVAWEGDLASGTVELKPSGWGTKVTLTATPSEAPVVADGRTADGVAAASDDETASDPVPEPVPETHSENEPSTSLDSQPQAGTAATVAAEADRTSVPTPDNPAPAPDTPTRSVAPPSPFPSAAPPAPVPGGPAGARGGLLGRLFRRRRGVEPVAASPAGAVADVADVLEAEVPAAVEAAEVPAAVEAEVPAAVEAAESLAPEPESAAIGPEPEPEPASAVDSVASQPEAAEPVAAEMPRGLDPEDAMAVLSSALDTLGAAHHRPFSRG